jgi:orotate phosphoribosyltransferase
MHDDVLRLLPARQGHFRLESGHHGELWLDLERLCLDPEPVRRLAAKIAARLSRHRVEAVCGPLIEGAFVGLMVASELAVPFTYAQPRARAQSSPSFYPVDYRIPAVLRGAVRGKRVAIVNDVINAGSAVRGTFFDLESCGAEVAAIGTLAVLGQWAARFAAEKQVPLETIASLANDVWAPTDCPLCARGVPLEDLLESAGSQIVS